MTNDTLYSDIIGRGGGDEKNEWPCRTDKSWTLIFFFLNKLCNFTKLSTEVEPEGNSLCNLNVKWSSSKVLSITNLLYLLLEHTTYCKQGTICKNLILALILEYMALQNL